MLSPTHLTRLFEGLRRTFDFSQCAELTLEANPATFTSRTARLYRDLGVNRVSLGIQSFHPEHLRTLGREHDPHQATASFHLLREVSGLAVNIDLIFSLPGQTVEDWRQTLQATRDLAPEHISAYNLTYEEDTPFFERFQSGAYRDDPERNAAMFSLADDLLGASGYHHYETSNYARPGFESLHNRGYWRGADYLGLGPSAVSTMAGHRWKNVPDTRRYLAMIERIGRAETEVEDLRPSQLRLERLALLLRTSEGVPRQHLRDVSPERIAQLTEECLATLTSHRLTLTGRGPLLVDSILEHLVS